MLIVFLRKPRTPTANSTDTLIPCPPLFGSFAFTVVSYARFHLCRTAGCGDTAGRQGRSRKRAAQQRRLPMQMIGRLLPRVLACGLLVGFVAGCGVNHIPTYDEAVKATWAQVEDK